MVNQKELHYTFSSLARYAGISLHFHPVHNRHSAGGYRLQKYASLYQIETKYNKIHLLNLILLYSMVPIWIMMESIINISSFYLWRLFDLNQTHSAVASYGQSVMVTEPGYLNTSHCTCLKQRQKLYGTSIEITIRYIVHLSHDNSELSSVSPPASGKF